jgi:hypothetical protein
VSRTVAVARYALAELLRSQRFLPPLVAYLGLLAVLHASPGPLLPGYGASAAALVPAGAWLTLCLHNAEDRVQAAVTVVNAGGHLRVLLGRTYGSIAGVLVLTAVALLWPALAAARVPAPADLAAGLCAHLVCGLTAVALGTCCARPLIGRQGHAFAAAVLLSVVVLVARPLTPVNETVRLFGAAPPRPSFAVLLPLVAGAAALTAAAVALALFVARRRG